MAGNSSQDFPSPGLSHTFLDATPDGWERALRVETKRNASALL